MDTHRILVVDDEPSVGKALAMGLASQEVPVDVTTDGESAIQLACTERYSILIADLHLLGMNGIEVIRRIKGRHPKIIPILITAYPTEDYRREARQNGVSHFFEKPFTLKAIKTAVMQALAERNAVGE
jgi:DNA-binding NtrC family response regulator